MRERRVFLGRMAILSERNVHNKADLGMNSHSWKYIQQSIRNGVLEDLEQYRVGPPAGTVRDIGSVIQPTKGSRTPFTVEDDRVLYDWVEGSEDQGSATGGNVIFKQLEEKVYRAQMLYAR